MPGFIQNQAAGNYLAGRRNAQDERYGDVRNQLGQQAIQQNQNEFADRAAGIDANKQKATAERLFLAAQYAVQNPAPKAFIEQNYPEIAQLVGAEWATADDARVKQEMQNVLGKYGPQAGVGPAIPKTLEPFTLGQGQKRFNPDGTEIAAVEPKKSNGISMTMPDGTEVQIGGDGVPNYGGVPITKPNQTKLQDAFINAQGNSYALREQLAKYRDEFSTLSGRAKAGIAAGKELIGMENAPQQQQFLNDFTSWKADTASLLSQYLNQLSGAAISPTEETRLKGGFPSADDSPTQYKAKAEATMRRFALVQARTAYLLSNPAQALDSVSLDGMSNIIAVEANKLAKALEKGGMAADQAQQQAILKTRQRFGMDQ